MAKIICVYVHQISFVVDSLCLPSYFNLVPAFPLPSNQSCILYLSFWEQMLVAFPCTSLWDQRPDLFLFVYSPWGSHQNSSAQQGPRLRLSDLLDADISLTEISQIACCWVSRNRMWLSAISLPWPNQPCLPYWTSPPSLLVKPFLVVSGYRCDFPVRGYASLDPESSSSGLCFCCLSSASWSDVDWNCRGDVRFLRMLRRWR